MHSIFTKTRYSLLPFPDQTKVNELLDWDLFGPLIITISLIIILLMKGTSSYTALFTSVFFLVLIGSSMVTLNGKLIGLKFSFFFYVSVLCYCLAPMLLAAIISLLLGKYITRIGVAVVAVACLLWCVKSASTFFFLTVDKSKSCMVMYPVLLFYMFFAAFIALQ